MSQTLTRILACAAPPVWFCACVATIWTTTPYFFMFLLPCAALFIFSSIAAWRATRSPTGADDVGVIMRTGLHLAGIWILPFALFALFGLIHYKLIIPTSIVMLLPVVAYVLQPGNTRIFSLAIALSLACAAVVAWSTIARHLPEASYSRILITLETVAGCAAAAMPAWTLAAFTRLILLHHRLTPISMGVVALAPLALVLALFQIMAIALDGWTD